MSALSEHPLYPSTVLLLLWRQCDPARCISDGSYNCSLHKLKRNGKATLVRGRRGLGGSGQLGLPDFMTIGTGKSYIKCPQYFFFFVALRPNAGHSLLVLEVF